MGIPVYTSFSVDIINRRHSSSSCIQPDSSNESGGLLDFSDVDALNGMLVIYAQIYICARTYVCMYIYRFVYIYAYVLMCTHTNTYIYACMHLQTLIYHIITLNHNFI